MDYVLDTLGNLAKQTAFATLSWGNILMILVAFLFLYLAIAKDFEPLLLHLHNPVDRRGEHRSRTYFGCIVPRT